MTGTIFNIQRCSLQDGPGIRTTVFFKGCPLRCLWCHNPESWAVGPELSFSTRKCTGCGACVAVCPQKVHTINEKGHSIDRSACVFCGACVKNCPADALEIIGAEKTVEEIMADVVRDIPFYKNSGGGMTLSGGEPFMQGELTMALLQAGKKEGLHICVETSGFAQAALVRESMPYVDIYLFDYKATRSDAHKYFIGAPNELIVSNLIMLLDTGAKVILRCPMVEGVNDSPDHLEGIAALYKAYPALLGVEIMAYHNMGRDKGIRVGLDEEQMLDLPLTLEPVKTRWIDELHRLGCSIAKIG